MKQILIFVAILLMISSCGTSPKDDAYMADMEIASDVQPLSVARSAGVKSEAKDKVPVDYTDKKIIKDAQVGVEVDDYYEYRSLIDSLINQLGGYISNDNLNKSDYSINGNLTIRIPAAKFEHFISLLEKGTDKLLYKNISARDVTEEFIDIEARLKSKKEVEKRYLELLSQARNVKEILEVEEKLRIIREEIEAREGRLNYLKKQVSYSTINLQITQQLDYKYEPAKEKSFFQRLLKSLDKGWKGFVSFLLFLFRIWPVLLIGFLTFYYIRRIKRKRKLQKDELKKQQHIKQKRYYRKPNKAKKEDKSKTNN
jgi:hypothetical protein